jgi:4-hydroxy-tetrahydrodipicolinate reductase
MGRTVESLCPEFGCEVAGIADIDPPLAAFEKSGADVAIDFTTAEAFLANLPQLVRMRVAVVVGTTGWNDREAEARRLVEDGGIGLVAAANFSLGVNLFEALVSRAADLIGTRTDFGAWIHESHHAAKRDAPSGTALTLQRAIERAGYPRAIDMSSTRAGWLPGTHTIGFDGPAETIVLTHTTRDRSTFARGALQAAKWVRGRRGWFTMKDVLGITE